MKKSSLPVLLSTLFFGALTYYFMYHADQGADGLSTFVPLVFAGVLFICSLLAFLLTLFLGKGQSSTKRRWILGVAIGMPILGFLSVTGIFSYFNYEYQSQWEDEIALQKSVLKTLQFQDSTFGVAFDHASGNVTSYENSIPIPTPITPQIKNGILFVPVNDHSYHNPDVLLKLEVTTTENVLDFLGNLEENLELQDTKFVKISSKNFPQLASSTEIWKMERARISTNDMPKLMRYFLPGQEDFPELAYFLKSPKKADQLWVLLVYNTVLSAPASVEKMNTSNFEDGNLWFHTLEFFH